MKYNKYAVIKDHLISWFLMLCITVKTICFTTSKMCKNVIFLFHSFMYIIVSQFAVIISTASLHEKRKRNHNKFTKIASNF